MNGLYSIAKQTKATLEDNVTLYGEILASFPKGPMGLTPDHVRATAEWKEAKEMYDSAFQSLRDFNAIFCKQFAPQIREERHDRMFAHPDRLDEAVQK